jgi:putative two-component system response regulator
MSVSRSKRELWPDGGPRSRVLVVDDDALVCRSLRQLLDSQGYETACATGARQAVQVLDEQGFELVLCDVRMPGESGLELVERINEEHPEVAVLMVSGLDDRQVAERALELGAYDYVVKPFRPNDVFVAVANALRRRKLARESLVDRQRLVLATIEHRGALRCATEDLEAHKALLKQARRDTLLRLARAAELRNAEIGHHLERVGRCSEVLARRLGLGDAQAEAIGSASALHDVGKIGLPDQILLKRGPLEVVERQAMERHTEVGYALLTDGNDELLGLAATIALTHHERIDGEGYPRGLVGDAIPLEGRIVAIADAYDALTSDRPYRSAASCEEAILEIRAHTGTQFDARLVGMFLGGLDEINDIRTALLDDTEASSLRGAG